MLEHSRSPQHGADPTDTEAARQLIQVLDTINDRVYLKNISGRVTYINQAFLTAYNLTAEQVIGHDYNDFLPEEMILLCQAADRTVLDEGKPICLETSWQDSAGKRHWTETHKSPLRDPAGKIVGIVGVSRDITARRTTEEELKRQKALLEQVVETVPDGIFVKDRERRVILANQAYYSIHGYVQDDIVGQETTQHLPAGLRELAYDSDTVVLEKGVSHRSNVTVIDPAGNERSLEVRKLPLLEEGEVAGILSVGRDLTEEKKAKEQSKRNESLLLHASRLSSTGELVAGIAHEVNQPLFSILNYAKAIENALRDDEHLDVAAARKWIQQIRKEAARGGKITQRLKSFVKPTETQQELTDLNLVVTESLEFLTIDARDASLRIEVELAKDLPTLLLDRIQIQQVLVNLLKNALEAMAEFPSSGSSSPELDAPRVLVSTQRTPRGAEVWVADNGPGVIVEDEANILEPFQTTKHDGLGLGLAISNTIIEAHQGKLTYGPNDWGGVTFKFTLPVVD